MGDVQASMVHVLKSAVDRMSYHVMVTDRHGVIKYVNPAFERTTGYSREEVIGKNPRILKSGEQSPEYYCSLWNTILSGREFSSVVKNKKKNGEIYFADQLVSPIKDDNGEITHFVSTWEDITARLSWEKQLEETNLALQRQTWGLEKSNQAIKILYKELETKNEELKKTNQLKSDFVSAVSHEIRTPLAIAMEGMNLVIDGSLGELKERQTKVLVTSIRNLHRLGVIINDLLDISKIESGRMCLQLEAVNLCNILKEAAEDFHGILQGKHIVLAVDVPSQPVDIIIDRGKVLQVLFNLLNNAYKFTPENGRIILSLSRRPDNVLISVEDTGEGIAKENLSKLFNKFQQFSRTGGPGLRGTGLGLAICKGLVELHRGKIWVESETNLGTKVSFTLPMFH